MVLFIMLYKVVFTFEKKDEILKFTIQMKADREYYFPGYRFVVPSFDSVDEILKCDYSNESYWGLLFCGDVYYAVQGGSIF